MRAAVRAGIRRIRAGRGRAWLAAALLLLASATIVAVAVHYTWQSASSIPEAPPVHFRTLPVGASLPSGTQCARWVRASPDPASPDPEARPANEIYNHTTGRGVGPGFFPAGDSPKAWALAPRINGDFTGTTLHILRWAACKWGINQNVVFAQAAVESWWRQGQLGDWATDAALCPPGHGIGADGMPGKCPRSYGVLQNNYTFEKAAWPAIRTSTAMNADAAYAVWRSCYDGYEVWLNDEPRGRQYQAGDLWGCVGRWFAGGWHTQAADHYIQQVQKFLHEGIWERPRFDSAG